MKILISSIVITLLVVSTPEISYSQKFISTQWTMDDGLPASSVNDLVQTKDGYLWLATFGGLVRFDGISFTVFNRSNTTEIRSDRILSVNETSDGSLWCSTESEILRYKEGKFSTYYIQNGETNYSASLFVEDAAGVVWIVSDSQIYHFKNNQFISVPVLRDSVSARKAKDGKRGVWLFYGREVVRTFGDSIAVVMDFSKNIQNTISDFAEYPKNSGVYWVATRGDGLLRISQNSLKKFSKKEGLASVYARQLFIDKSNSMLVVCFDGISRFNGENFSLIRTINDKTEKEFNTMMQDREGNYWIGTPANGLRKLRPTIVSTIGKDQGLEESKMLSLTKRKNGSFLFATNCGGIYEWENGKAAYSAMNKFLINLCVWSVFEDSKNRVWVGSRVLQRFDDITKRGQLMDSSKGFSGQDIFSIMEDSKGNIWIGCLNGLYRFDGENFRRYSIKDGLSKNDVRVLYEDKSGILWIGTSQGLNKFSNGEISQVPLVMSGKNSTYIKSDYIRAIYQDSDGTLWFGSYGGGLARLKNGKFFFITTQEGMYDDIVSHIVEGDKGNFWMGCNRGIARVSKKELNDVADGNSSQVNAYVYTKSDGMESSETNGGFQPSFVKDESGNIYFSTVSGIVVVATQNVQKNSIVPPVIIEGISVKNKLFPFTSSITIPSDSSEIEIHYTSLSYTDPSKNQFKYKLVGKDNSWINVGSRRTAFYTELPPGNYTFTVLGSNNDGVWNTDGASIKLNILPPFWKTTWFIALMVVVLLTAGPSVLYYRISQLNMEKKKQERFAQQLIDSQEQERRRIAAELHDGLGQQILVIKNRAEMALRQVDNPQKITEQLQEIMESAMSSIGDVRAISHDLRPVNLEQFGLTEALTNLCDQLQNTSGFKWHYHVDDIDGMIPKEKEINFYRIIQEGTNNILKHSSAKQGSIIVRRIEKNIIAVLWDDGEGFDINKKKKSGGLGLSGIDERVKTLRGIFDLQSGAEQGTTLKIIIPVQNNEQYS